MTARACSHTATITKVVISLHLGSYLVKNQPMVQQALPHITKARETIQMGQTPAATQTCTKHPPLKWFKTIPTNPINRNQLPQRMSLWILRDSFWVQDLHQTPQL